MKFVITDKSVDRVNQCTEDLLIVPFMQFYIIELDYHMPHSSLNVDNRLMLQRDQFCVLWYSVVQFTHAIFARVGRLQVCKHKII